MKVIIGRHVCHGGMGGHGNKSTEGVDSELGRQIALCYHELS